jgi:predicted nucleic acid-binding protein
MNASKGLILDANILIRAAFGTRVREVLERYEDVAKFYTPDSCFDDAEKYVPIVSKQRGLDADLGLSVLHQVSGIVDRVDRSLYEDHEPMARQRIGSRDLDDWPVIATALLFELPIWTEDQDFFGSGIAVWTTDRVELYLREH